MDRRRKQGTLSHRQDGQEKCLFVSCVDENENDDVRAVMKRLHNESTLPVKTRQNCLAEIARWRQNAWIAKYTHDAEVVVVLASPRNIASIALSYVEGSVLREKPLGDEETWDPKVGSRFVVFQAGSSIPEFLKGHQVFLDIDMLIEYVNSHSPVEVAGAADSPPCDDSESDDYE